MTVSVSAFRPVEFRADVRFRKRDVWNRAVDDLAEPLPTVTTTDIQFVVPRIAIEVLTNGGGMIAESLPITRLFENIGAVHMLVQQHTLFKLLHSA